MPAERAGNGYSPNPQDGDLGGVGHAGREHGEPNDAAEAPVDFFISYTYPDSEWAEWVAWVLEDAGYITRIQAWDFSPGNGFVSEMHQGTQHSARTVAVLSNAYLESEYAEAEWQAVWAADPSGRERRLLAVRIEDCPRPGLLKQLITVDVFGVDRETAADRLLIAAHGVRGKPDAEPPFPGAAQVSVEQPDAEPASPGEEASASRPGRQRRRGQRRRTGRVRLSAAAFAGGTVILMLAMILGLGGWISGGLWFGGGFTGGGTGADSDAHDATSPDPAEQSRETQGVLLTVSDGQHSPPTGATPLADGPDAGVREPGTSAGSAPPPIGTSTPRPAGSGADAGGMPSQAGASTQPAASPSATKDCEDGLPNPLLGTLGLGQC